MKTLHTMKGNNNDFAFFIPKFQAFFKLEKSAPPQGYDHATQEEK